MNRFKSLAMLICAVSLMMGAVSCKKEDAVKTGEKMTIGASISRSGNGGTKTGLEPHEGYCDVVWSPADKIMLYSQTAGETFYISEGMGTTEASFAGLKPGDAPYYGFYPASGCTCTGVGKFTIGIPASKPYSDFIENAGPMAGYSEDGKTLAFQNAMSWLNIGFTGDATIKSVELTDKSGKCLNGTLQVTVNDDHTLTTEMTGGTSTLSIVSTAGVPLNNDEPVVFKFLVPAGAFTGEKNVEIKVTTESSIPKTFTRTLQDGIAAGKVYNANIKTKIKQPGFSVTNGKRVFFSPGNLQCLPCEKKWQFASKQWERCDNNTSDHLLDVSKYTASGTSWIDWFAWGTSGNDHGAISFQPWSFDGLSNTNYMAYGDINKDLNADDGSADWGYGKTINGKNDWRTLSYDEWYYLLNSRENAVGLKSTGNINGVNGAIFLPDEWICPEGASFIPNATDYATNTYTEEQWEVMESAGAAFLPAAGSFDANSLPRFITMINQWGWYWSTTHDGKTATDSGTPNAFYAAGGLVIIPGNIFTAMGCDRSDGFSVRLVRDAD